MRVLPNTFLTPLNLSIMHQISEPLSVISDQGGVYADILGSVADLEWRPSVDRQDGIGRMVDLAMSLLLSWKCR